MTPLKKRNNKFGSPIPRDENYLKRLEDVFDHIEIPSDYYSLNGYSEDAICIERSDGMWIVYNGEKGNKYNLKKYRATLEACIDMILRISESEEEQIRIQSMFMRNVLMDKISNKSVTTQEPRAVGRTIAIKKGKAILRGAPIVFQRKSQSVKEPDYGRAWRASLKKSQGIK